MGNSQSDEQYGEVCDRGDMDVYGISRWVKYDHINNANNTYNISNHNNDNKHIKQSCNCKKNTNPIISCITSQSDISDEMRLKIAQLIIECKSFDPNFQDSNGYTSLMWCIMCDGELNEEIRLSMANMIMNHGSFDSNIQDNNGDTALMWIICTAYADNDIRLQIAQNIINHPSFDPNVINNKGESALSICLYNALELDGNTRFSLFKLLMKHHNLNPNV
jgi:ankyrin repeat protein